MFKFIKSIKLGNWAQEFLIIDFIRYLTTRRINNKLKFRGRLQITREQMNDSPLRKDYISTISTRKRGPTKSRGKDSQKPRTQRADQENCEVFSNCIRTKIFPQNRTQSDTDYFQTLLLSNGIFMISRVHPYQSYQKKNLSKCSPQQQCSTLKSLFLFPTHTLVQCQYNAQNQFHKEMIFYCPGKYLIVNYFTNGLLDKDQYNFSLKDSILLKSKYDKGRLSLVEDYFLGRQTNTDEQCAHKTLNFKLQKHLANKELCKQIYKLTEGYFQWLQPIQTISGDTSHYGQLSQQTYSPQGFGLLISRRQQGKSLKKNIDQTQKSIIQFNLDLHQSTPTQQLDWELYYGNFQNGLLDKIGSIWFREKSSYFGEFQLGNFVGLGQFYSTADKYSDQVQAEQSNFHFKDSKRTINRNVFMKFIKQEYFDSKKSYGNENNFNFIQNQYQKLTKIYSIAINFTIQRDNKFFLQQARRKQIKQNIIQNINELQQSSEQGSKVLVNTRSQKQQAIPNNNNEVRDIFKKIKVSDPKTQRFNAGFQRKNIGFECMEVEMAQIGKKTSRSDDHNYHRPDIRTQTTTNYYENQIRKNGLRKIVQDQQWDNGSPNTGSLSKAALNPKISNKLQSVRIVDLGYQQVGSDYFKMREVSSTSRNCLQQDYIQKQYAFQQPKRFKSPDYFIVENSKNHYKYDPSTSKMQWLPEDKLFKNNYHILSPLKPEKYLVPEQKPSFRYCQVEQKQKQNLYDIRKYERAVSKGKIRRIFNNTAKDTKPLMH